MSLLSREIGDITEDVYTRWRNKEGITGLPMKNDVSVVLKDLLGPLFSELLSIIFELP